eukprot:scaffold1875_cov253-Pinguiococcus_pyrenoidosus.AAC.9
MHLALSLLRRLGLVNGISQMGAAMARSAGPLMAGTLWAVGLDIVWAPCLLTFAVLTGEILPRRRSDGWRVAATNLTCFLRTRAHHRSNWTGIRNEIPIGRCEAEPATARRARLRGTDAHARQPRPARRSRRGEGLGYSLCSSLRRRSVNLLDKPITESISPVILDDVRKSKKASVSQALDLAPDGKRGSTVR